MREEKKLPTKNVEGMEGATIRNVIDYDEGTSLSLRDIAGCVPDTCYKKLAPLN